MFKKAAFTMLAAAMAVAGFGASSAIAGGAADKATGDVNWGEDLRHAEFDAHAAMGNRPAKGTLFQEHAADDEHGPGAFSVDVEGVVVDGDTACFWGETHGATGTFADHNGETRVTKVVDGGEPGVGVDSVQGRWSSADPQDVCDDMNAPAGHTTSGNVQVHAG